MRREWLTTKEATDQLGLGRYILHAVVRIGLVVPKKVKRHGRRVNLYRKEDIVRLTKGPL